MSKVEIRTVTADDAADICRLSREDLGYDCDESFVRRRIEELDRDREEVFTAVIDGGTVGFVHAEVYKTLYYETMVNYLGVAVSGKYRRLGIGTSLINAAEQWARSKGIGLIRLNSGSSRTGAHEFYSRLGI